MSLVPLNFSSFLCLYELWSGSTKTREIKRARSHILSGIPNGPLSLASFGFHRPTEQTELCVLLFTTSSFFWPLITRDTCLLELWIVGKVSGGADWDHKKKGEKNRILYLKNWTFAYWMTCLGTPGPLKNWNFHFSDYSQYGCQKSSNSIRNSGIRIELAFRIPEFGKKNWKSKISKYSHYRCQNSWNWMRNLKIHMKIHLDFRILKIVKFRIFQKFPEFRFWLKNFKILKWNSNFHLKLSEDSFDLLNPKLRIFQNFEFGRYRFQYFSNQK